MAAPTVAMIAPASFGGTIVGSVTGTQYSPNAAGLIQAYFPDVPTLTSLGFDQVVYPSLSGMIGYLLGANFNVTTDQTIPMLVGASQRYRITKITVTNASVSLTTAAGGVYPAASKGGTAIVASGQVYTALTTAAAAVDLTLASALRGTAAPILSLTTAQGAAATADVYVFGDLLLQ
jgi:hypothetical protein